MSKVIVGMSGGVDSSVAALLLKEQGYEVIGITFRFTDEFDATDAIDVCKAIGIEHHIIDYRDIFKEKVINKFINDYRKGITPNPCVMCNKYVKLQFLYDQMIKYNADYIATGHYAKIIDGRLYNSFDQNKDQTYFLSQMTKDELSKLLLPLEGISKEEVRDIALRNGLTIHSKKDSTDVCFITAKFNEFIESNIENKVGDIINLSTGKKIGKHNGLSHYTIGQRRGLNIGGTSDRMFVVSKDISKNILFVATQDSDSFLTSTSCLIESVNMFNDHIDECMARFRYRQQLTNVKLEYLQDGNILVNYPTGVRAVTPGQACVFYKDNECLGGGIIKEVYK